jgi:hypothetical protein
MVTIRILQYKSTEKFGSNIMNIHNDITLSVHYFLCIQHPIAKLLGNFEDYASFPLVFSHDYGKFVPVCRHP